MSVKLILVDICMHFEPGDIAACCGSDITSRLISWGTASLLAPAGLRIGPSHVAILCEFEQDLSWVESTTLCGHACRIRGERIAGTQVHFPEDRIEDYLSSGGSVALYRLSAVNRLDAAERHLLTSILIDHFVRQRLTYDLSGAICSGTRVFQLTQFFPGADLNSLFCSEMVAAALMRLNRMNHANPTRFNPARLLRTLVRNGTYTCVHDFR